jgi:hypothetical protein
MPGWSGSKALDAGAKDATVKKDATKKKDPNAKADAKAKRDAKATLVLVPKI